MHAALTDSGPLACGAVRDGLYNMLSAYSKTLPENELELAALETTRRDLLGGNDGAAERRKWQALVVVIGEQRILNAGIDTLRGLD